ncbi:MAG TPA: hypothetical protein VKU36_00700 [Candidatus Babeliales bacterium]|nr:hypothetical protein [Candidatus Babeliales bacterium]
MMWPIPALEHKVVSILFFSNELVCCWIEKSAHNSLLTVRAYKRYPLTNLELVGLVIFNPTILKKYITSFLREHNLNDAFIVFSLGGSSITEQFVALPTSTPHYRDFSHNPGTRSIIWQYRYLYPHEDGQCMFYTYAVPRILLLQYQLLAMSIHCNLIKITTHSASVLLAYEHLFGKAFRRSQLAVDMIRVHNNVDALISVDALHRMVKVDTDINVVQERPYLAAAIGIWSGERIQ